jgi:hypothetical protein
MGGCAGKARARRPHDLVPTASILLLLTFRPEFRLPWGNRAHLTHLSINRFTRRQTALMVV